MSPSLTLSREPRALLDHAGDRLEVALTGRWTAEYAAALEAAVAEVERVSQDVRRVLFDLSGVERLDTAGAWVLDRTRHELGARGLGADFIGVREEHRILLDEVAYRGFQPAPPPRRASLIDFFAEIGMAVASAGRYLAGLVAFMGEFVTALIRVILRPARFRGTALVNQLEQVAYRGVPIIVMISFLVGCIVAQQGIFQLRRFGGTPFVVDMVSILTLRELAVLLTSIMVAGRSGSAFTAELGSMKMREEVDALRVMGLDPTEVLIVPRVLALIIGLPMLTLLSSLAALYGGGLVAWFYGDISPDVYLSRLRAAVSFETVMVGMVKAPFMAMIIGLIACQEGMAVSGSAESLGRHVTSSVVKAIFMVIVVDGLFAMFFAAIRF